MPIAIRFLLYASLGVAVEVVFTATCARLGIVLTPDLDDPDARAGWRLEGHSFVWMLPICGGGLLLFERVHDLLRSEPFLLRGFVYVVALYAIELAANLVLVRLTGARVWRWVGRGALGGHVHLAMAPVWFAATLVLEPLPDALVRTVSGSP